MRLHVIFRYIGYILLLNALALLLSAAVSLMYAERSFIILLYSGLIAALFGVFPLIFVPPVENITNNEGLVVVVASWLLSCLLGALPYFLWGVEFTFTNAWFESVSGFTTTGSSILTNVEAVPKGILFWRSMTHWLGGMGIIIFVLSILPFIGESARVLYQSEMSSLAMDNFQIRAKHAVRILAIIYLGLTVSETILLMIFGMNLFDALTHSFGTIATGGFSPKNASIAYYHSLPIEIVVIVFMILSGIHFGVLFSAAAGNFRSLFNSPFVRYYLISMGIGILISAASMYGSHYHNFPEALRYAAFQIASVGTSTGFATADSSVWPALAQVLLIFFTLQCACAGSTSGGIKVDRVVLLGKAFRRQMKQLQHPRGVIPITLEGRSIGKEVVESAILYIAIYLGVVFIATVLLIAVGTDALEAFSGTVATMGNVGPGLGKVGSMGNFNHIPTAGKWIFSMTMLLGRLEIYALILFFIPRHWKMYSTF